MSSATADQIPELRFQSFTPSWRVCRLEEVVDMYDSLHITPKEYVAEGYPMIRVADIKDKPLNFSECLKVTKDVFEQFTKRYKPQKGDIVLSRVGTCGSSIFLETDTETCLGQNTVLMRPKINNEFLLQLIRSPITQKQVDRTVVGSSHKTLSLTHLRGFKIVRPDEAEQRKIADFLTSVDERIGQLIKKKALLEDYKKGVMQQLFSQQIRFKDDNGNDFPDWEEKRVDELAYVNPKSPTLPERFIYIDLESVTKGRLHPPERIAKADAPSRAQRLLNKGDILFQCVRPYQKNNYLFNLDGAYVASTGFAQLRTGDNNSEFLYQSLHIHTFSKAVWSRCTGTSYPAINSNDLAEIKVFVPHVPEQKKIADFLSAIDQKIESVSQQIAKTQTFKKGLLQQMFV